MVTPFFNAKMNYKKKTLDNGMTLLMEKMNTVRSVALGVWVCTGSRDETSDKAGISHFLEHMFFKGTKTRSARDIAIDMDSLGGELNAFTSKEGTTFYIKVLDDFLESGVELLSDIFLNSTFSEDEIEREKGVVIEEIKMTEDTPDDLIHDIFSRTTWGDVSIGRPVLGTEDTVRSFSRDDLLAYTEDTYGFNSTIISCAGNFDEDKLVRILNKAFGGFTRKARQRNIIRPEFNVGSAIVERELSEAHICIGLEGIKQASDDRYAILLLNSALGGGMSSRLFQEVREKRGLAYSIYSFVSSYLDTGVLGIYAGTSPEKADEVINICAEQLKEIARTIDADEIERARTQLKGNIMLALESTGRRMQNIANQEIYYGRHFSPDDVIAQINSTTVDSVRELAVRLIDGKEFSLAALGTLNKKRN